MTPSAPTTHPLLANHSPGYAALLSQAIGLPPLKVAVVHPCSADALEGALDAAALGIIRPILVGPSAKIASVAKEAGRSLEGCTLVDVPHSHAAAEKAVALVHAGEAEALMKGALHTDELLGAILDRNLGLRTARRLSHVFVLDVPMYPKPLLVTDAAINILPDLETKADIAQNAIDLAKALGIAQPKMAILAAIETVNPKMPATIDAAALCKMADRGQIQGGILDGPLAFDNAISKEAAQSKGIHSSVPGEADILLVPDLEAGNILAKQLEYLAGAHTAGLVLGARCPIVLTSRSDPPASRVASCALALVAHHKPKA